MARPATERELRVFHAIARKERGWRLVASGVLAAIGLATTIASIASDGRLSSLRNHAPVWIVAIAGVPMFLWFGWRFIRLAADAIRSVSVEQFTGSFKTNGIGASTTCSVGERPVVVVESWVSGLNDHEGDVTVNVCPWAVWLLPSKKTVFVLAVHSDSGKLIVELEEEDASRGVTATPPF